MHLHYCLLGDIHNYHINQEMVCPLSPGKIIILRGVLDEVYQILSEIIVILLPHGRLADGHTPPITSFFSLNITGVYVIDDTISIILEMEDLILLQELGFNFLIIFLGGGGIPIFINVGTEFPHRMGLTIHRITIGTVVVV